ncbi:MAG TPA: FadR/GntR family transcriptional regulator [Candidatus Deferrimicrobium sp.]|nr:FadR/GntR family transcriptional regulator [Candidatus Deferrimicrobium sp.]
MTLDTSPLRPLGRTRLYEDLVDRLGEFVVRTNLEVGGRFPPERELASRLEVSRSSLRQALAVLEAQGFIEVRHGGGVFLRRSRGFGGMLHKLVERRARLPEVLEARELLEVRLAELAATRRADSDLAAMRAALTQMEAEVDANDLGVAGDSAFHMAVHRAGNNKVLEHVIDGLAEAIHETRLESLSEPGRPRNSLVAHRRILEAIEAGDPARAADAMRAHLRQVSDVALLRWEPPAEEA